ncbi:hypothetical protein D3C76_1828130 [compost metagenome]
MAGFSAGVSRNRIELRSHFSGTMPFSRRKLARMVAGTPNSVYWPVAALMPGVVSSSLHGSTRYWSCA